MTQTAIVLDALSRDALAIAIFPAQVELYQLITVFEGTPDAETRP